MLKPAKPDDELLRLEALRSLKILDTDPEERFDRFTRLAKQLFGTSSALVSLVDADRQWFKSRQGLDATETSREVSFCGHAILKNEVLIVSDAQEDERFADNPLVCGDPNIRFYAGCPLSGPDGRKVGTLCLIDDAPRGMTPEELSLLEQLGSMVEEELVIAGFLNVDPTTGISNRAGFAIIGDHLLGMCRKTRVPASLLLFCIANCDEIEGGAIDRVAIEVTQLLLATFRESDIVGRLSQDTFAVLLTGPQHHEMAEIRKRLLNSVNKRNSANTGGHEIMLDYCDLKYDGSSHSNTEALIEAAEMLFDIDDAQTINDDAQTANAATVLTASPI